MSGDKEKGINRESQRIECSRTFLGEMPMEECYFAGGNSGEGFYDCFDQIIPKGEKKEHVIILKGGPGVGKSTLMKRVARAAMKKKEKTELFWCSGDPDSLDAVRIVGRGILILDGTAPHCKDPVYPGAVEEILNLGEQIDREKILLRRSEIVQLSQENKEYYRRAYALLRCAAGLEEEVMREVFDCLDKKRVNKLWETICGGPEEKDGEGGEERGEKARTLFLDAITWKGRVSFAEEMVQGRRSVGMKGEAAGALLDYMVRQSDSRGFWCLNPLLPERVSHIIFENRNLFVTSAAVETDQSEESEEYFCRKPSAELFRYQKEKERLVSMAVKCLKQCKKLHDELEGCYRECVDFIKITERSDELLRKLGL